MTIRRPEKVSQSFAYIVEIFHFLPPTAHDLLQLISATLERVSEWISDSFSVWPFFYIWKSKLNQGENANPKPINRGWLDLCVITIIAVGLIATPLINGRIDLMEVTMTVKWNHTNRRYIMVDNFELPRERKYLQFKIKSDSLSGRYLHAFALWTSHRWAVDEKQYLLLNWRFVWSDELWHWPAFVYFLNK